MRTLGNILWHFPFLGFVSALATFLVGGALTLLVVTAPIGLGLMQLAKFMLAPFSYCMVSKDELAIEQNRYWKAYSSLIMILYLPLGCILAVVATVQVVLLFFTIIGIPVALVLAKSLGTYFNPVGKICVPMAVGDALYRRQMDEAVQAYRRQK